MGFDQRIAKLLESLWQDYIHRLCPSALSIQSLLKEGMGLHNDHIALRTFNHPMTE